jgi:alpha-methylacyl-CoA racemase
MTKTKQSGPLAGLKVLEFAGMGPAPFSGMLLSDLGADVVRIDRAQGPDYLPQDVESRGRHSIVLDLKNPDDLATAKALAGKADILIEGFRPGVMERLGLGPEQIHKTNPKLIYGRITGWGQTGPLAQKAGHDINYLSLTGALHAMGTKEKPAIPLNLIADFGGGSLYLIMGILAALHHARNTGEGQVIDAAMTDGVISLMNMIYGDFNAGSWKDERESNVIDGAAPFYNVYRCADDKWISLACIEPQFYRAFIDNTELEQSAFENQWQREDWPAQKTILESMFLKKTREQWIEHFEKHDVCIAPVLNLQEAQNHPHNINRHSFQTIDGISQANAMPRMNQNTPATAFGVRKKNADRAEIISRWEIE